MLARIEIAQPRSQRVVQSGQGEGEAQRFEVPCGKEQQLQSGSIELAQLGAIDACIAGRARITDFARPLLDLRPQFGHLVDHQLLAKRGQGRPKFGGVRVRRFAGRAGHRHHCGTSWATAARICGGWNGLVIQALAPASLPAVILAALLSVVSMITGVYL